MKAKLTSTARPAFWSRTALTALAIGAMLGTAQADMYHPATNTPGGVVAASTVTSITTVGTNTTVCWYGMQGWYGVEMSTNAGATWQQVGRGASSDFPGCLTVNNGSNASASFRLNQANGYAGSGACAGCHGDKYSEWKGTRHSSAYSTIANLPMPQVVKDTCLPCHSVGMNQGGFSTIANTPHLTDVGCETCHGPAGWHKYSDHDLVRPAVSIDPKICGGCHTDDHHPTLEEYEQSLHAEVNDDIKYGFANGVYFPDTIVMAGTNVVAPGSPGSSNVYGFYITTNANLTLKTNATTGIIHSQRGNPNNLYDPGQDRALSCGICHSGAARMAMLKDYEARLAGITNVLECPSTSDEALWGPTCAVCHDPHSDENRAQLRNPVWSTNYFTMPTTTDKRTVYTTNLMGAVTTKVVFYNAAFANLYDPNVQVCGQCHNSRGGRWDGRSYGYYMTNSLLSVTTNGPGIVYGVQTNVSYSRPPHHSPQYNILSGIVQPDYLNGTSNVFGAHSLNTNGCAACHMPTRSFASPTPENPNYTGHEFSPLVPGVDAFNGCSVAGCHDGIATSIDPTNGIIALRLDITNQISTLVSNLINWTVVKGTNTFGGANAFKYKQNGWEYTTPGALSLSTLAGPSAADQLKIPVGIRQARFNLYMVSYGNAESLGIHNPTYTRFLLNDASNKVWQATQ